MRDKCGREIHYLRLSITDRCNLKCKYCMPDGVAKCEHSDVLTYEEMLRVIKILSKLGIDTVRVTGGEPLVRKGIERLLKGIKEVQGIQRVSLTTNGVLLTQQLGSLIDVGVNTINISLDTLKRDRFQEITGFDKLQDVLAGGKQALAYGVPVKINCVPQAGVNEDELIDIAMLARDNKIEVRFIEMMPVGQGKNVTGIDNTKLKAQLEKEFGTMTYIDCKQGAGPAVSYQIEGFVGTIGFISAMHGKFCSSCNRIRLTSQGFLKGCLASNQGLDVRQLLREHVSDEVLLEKVKEAIYQKPSEHHFESLQDITENQSMYSIGG